jgi:predicted metal-binding membrane protein
MVPDPGLPPSGQHGARFLEHALLLVAVALLLSWWWIASMARDMYGTMSGPAAWMMTAEWDVTHLLLLWLMWAVMMAAMMLPSAWPMLTIFAGFSRRRAGRSPSFYAFIGGYLLTWVAFSLAATVLQRLLAQLLLLSPMMQVASPKVGAAFLIAAGVYQLTPLKRICLGWCRSPMSFVMQHWRNGAAGALRMGAQHGAYCVGCCWLLMLLLFAGGVMNIWVIAALTAFVAFEKLVPWREGGSRLSGLVLIASGVWLGLL